MQVCVSRCFSCPSSAHLLTCCTTTALAKSGGYQQTLSAHRTKHSHSHLKEWVQTLVQQMTDRKHVGFLQVLFLLLPSVKQVHGKSAYHI